MKNSDFIKANPGLLKDSMDNTNRIFIIKSSQNRSIVGTIVKTAIAMTVAKAIVNHVVEHAVDTYISRELDEELSKRRKSFINSMKGVKKSDD